jgi:alpha-L-fucosidase 2
MNNKTSPLTLQHRGFAVVIHHRVVMVGLCMLLGLQAATASDEGKTDAPSKLAAYHVVWDSPSNDSTGSMPLGNGDLGVNAWVEPSGDLVLLLSKTDAWSGNCRLLKLGRIRIRVTPSPFVVDAPFRQELHLSHGEMTIRFGEGSAATRLRVWVDAHQPVVRIEADGGRPADLEATLEVWRDGKRELKGDEAHSAYGLHGGPDAIVCHPDTVLAGQPDRIVWYHRNEHSIWAENLRHQGLEALSDSLEDPLLHRTFGGMIEGNGLQSDGPRTLSSREPRNRFVLAVHLYSAQTPTATDWLEALERQAAATRQMPLDTARAAHRDWWQRFWERSWIFIDGTTDAEVVTRGYVLQRWMNACAGRGVHPIKFNGSLFTVDMAGFDPDYRRWGGPYWWQNTRLPYWPMLGSGDFEFMLPLFRMYQATLPLAEYRTEAWFGHDGAFFPETMYFWGMFTNANYGWNRSGLPVGEVTNRFIRREYTSSLELMAMMLDYYDYRRDESFLEEYLLPLSDSLLKFWDQHYQRNAEGRMVIYPAQALETLQDARNPTPDIAGLLWVLGKLLELPEPTVGAERHSFWKQLEAAIPPLPMAGDDGQRWLLGAEQVFGGRGNSENPELYAVFPFRLYGMGKPDLDIGLRTFEKRTVRGNTGWRQDDTQAALLGLGDVAANFVVGRAKQKHAGSRFPAFWGPNFDWIPDQDHGGNLMSALQAMLLHAEGDQIRLLPAWPRTWNVEFKLHAPRQTTVQGIYRDGKLEHLTVTPPDRRQDIRLMLDEPGS